MDILYFILKYSPVWGSVALGLWAWHGLISAPPFSEEDDEPYGEASSYRRDRQP
ncbi:hypothetical protein [Chelatococcus sp. YT9]|uniref:hypothetical protein n=1 Tax=Chelatococcus sp. YT9 TaxID=2835635 RepID=UPI001BCE295B|nr:hypothetical protein [Chelatococcus sp. YT9]MBS7698577.1 hypothetical protein [Chelatococcus sp. YT9]